MSQKHRFINNGRSPIPMGAAAHYACVCGKTGTREDIQRHIATKSTHDNAEKIVREVSAREIAQTAPYEQLVIDNSDDVCGGDTMAHYLPMEPRAPAALSFNEIPTPTPPELPPPPMVRPCSIAESFQTMLRIAYQAGVMATTNGETFETWYQREVLQ